jgi:hypothetical protein
MFKNGLIFDRHPVLVTTFLAAFLQVLSSLVLHWTDNQQALLNAAIAAILGFIAAAGIAVDKALPALVGVVQAVLSVAVGFGAHITDSQMSMISALVASGVALWTYDRVTAKVGAVGGRASNVKQL